MPKIRSVCVFLFLSLCASILPLLVMSGWAVIDDTTRTVGFFSTLGMLFSDFGTYVFWQKESLLVAVLLFGGIVFNEGVNRKLKWSSIVLAVHGFAGFFLMYVRGMGGL